MATNVILKSSDDKTFTVTEDCAKQSKMVSELMKDRENDSEAVPILKVEGDVLEKVVEWMKYHAEHPNMYPNYKPEDRAKDDPLDNWDKEWCDKLEKHLMFEIIKAAAFMQLDILVECTARTIAGHLVGKSVEEMREYLEEPNDYTPEEMAEMDKKYAKYYKN